MADVQIVRSKASSGFKNYADSSHSNRIFYETPTPYLKRKRTDITPAVKKEICLYKESNPLVSQDKIAQIFKEKYGLNIGRSTISDIILKRDKWMAIDDARALSKRLRTPKFESLENALFLWYCENISQNVITDDILLKRAKKFGQGLNVENFAYSRGWLSNFKKRNGINLRVKDRDTVSSAQNTLVVLPPPNCKGVESDVSSKLNGNSLDSIHILQDYETTSEEETPKYNFQESNKSVAVSAEEFTAEEFCTNLDSGELTEFKSMKHKKGGLRRNRSEADFKELTKKDAQLQLAQELAKLLQTATGYRRDVIEKEFDGFKQLFARFLIETGPSLAWDLIEPLPETAVKDYSSLSEPKIDNIKSMLDKLVVVKLNGGLGTSMGCTGPKSLISVRNDLTFLDLTVQQIEHLNRTYDSDVPLVLMNSFNTDDDTSKILRKYKSFKVNILTFNQSRYPRINRESLMPITNTIDGDLDAWYPPGHGDFYQAFHNSGLLNDLVKKGKEYCFVSNIDNLGATVDLAILNYLLNPMNTNLPHPEYVMEVTDKTRADVKGGTLVQYEGKLRLLEIAQVPKEHVDEFKSITKFKIFNTNNLWINMKAIQRILSEGEMDMEIIVNQKTLDNGMNVIQLETASGAAIKNFDGSVGINVPRSRFLPVKKTSDLLLVMSNLYTMRAGTLMMSLKRSFPSVPLVKLGDTHFAKVRDYLKRFASIPDMLELDHLTVSGDVTFGKAVVLKGTVIIIANHGDRIDIPSGAVLENKIVSGNLRILEH